MLLASPAQIERKVTCGLYPTLVGRGAQAELFLTATPMPGETLDALLTRVGNCLRGYEVRPVSMTVFAPERACRLAMASLPKSLASMNCPVTWLSPEDARPGQGGGVEVHALRGWNVTPIRLGSRVVGSVWQDRAARHCELGDLRDLAVTRTPAQQTAQVLEDITAALAQAGMSFRHVYRTWFRNRDILAWYGDFNRVRTDYYTRLAVLEGLLPASTGIGAGNPFGAALIAGVLAMEPLVPGLGPTMVESPLQDSPRKYGSSFSRAVEVDLGDQRRLTISGTASIDYHGATIHAGNVDAQLALTMRVVDALLRSRAMDWSDITRAVAYFRHGADIPACARWHAAAGIAPLPVIVGTHTVCRNDLLYEIEVDAVTPRSYRGSHQF